MIQRLSTSFRWLWLLLVLSGIAIAAALTREAPLFAYDAALEHIYRGVVFSDALSQGVLYPRWVQFLHFGLGSPLFTFHPPFAYYAQDVLFRLGLPHPDGWQALVAAGLLAACCGAYLLVRDLTGSRAAGVVAGVAYLYAPYLLRNTLVRGSTEALSMFFFPWVIWGLLWAARRPSPGRFVVAALLWAGCISAHVLAPLILAPFALLIGLAAAWHYRSLAPVGVLLAGGLLLAGFWMPVIVELDYVHVERDFNHPSAIPEDNPIPLRRLLAPPAVYDSGLGNNNMGDRIGLPHFALLLCGLPASLYAWARGRRGLAVTLTLATVLGLFLFWLFTESSDGFWRLFRPALSHVQYRTRLMAVQSLAMAVVAGCLMPLLAPRWRPVAAGLVCGVLILTAAPSLYVNLQHKWSEYSSYLSMQGVRQAEIDTGGRAFTAFAEFMPRWRTGFLEQDTLDELGPAFDPQERPLAGSLEGVIVHDVTVEPHRWEMNLETDSPQTATLHLFYYPRWEATLDGIVVPLRPAEWSGYTQLDLPAGSHNLTLHYTRTWAEWIGLGISGLTALLLALLAGLAVRGWLRRRRLSREPARSAFERDEAGKKSAPHAWLLAGLTLLLAFKVFFVDPHTGWLRCSSTADNLCDAGVADGLDIEFGGQFRLHGIRLTQDIIRPGGWVHLDLYWSVSAPVRERADVFVHLLGESFNPETGNPLWGQENKKTPGEHPVVEWVPGKIYRDSYSFKASPAAPAGEYALEIGWYRPAGDTRLSPQLHESGSTFSFSASHLDSLLIQGVRVR